MVERNESTHVLDTKSIETVRNWEEWKKAWERARTAAELDGLLHVGMSVALGEDEVEITDPTLSRASEEESDIPTVAEAVCFYLEIADGHYSIRNFRGGEKRPESTAYHRAALSLYRARKAVKVLAGTYLRAFAGGSYYRFWMSMFLQRSVLAKTLWFYRADELGGLRNSPGRNDERLDHYEKIIRQVPTGLARVIILQGHSSIWLPYGRRLDVTEQDFRDATPATVEMLHQTGELGILASLGADKITDGLEEKLLEIARREQGSYEKAVLENSEAAKVLAVLRAKRAASRATA